MSKRIFITAGHTLKGVDHGAVSKFGDESEEARKVVDALIKELNSKSIQVLTDNDEWTLSETISWIGSKISESEYNIDVHFNSFSNSNTSGTEVIVPCRYNSREFDLAYQIADYISKVLSIPNRGVKTEDESQHSHLGILSNPKLARANNILIEVCFISNPDDMKKYRDNFIALIKGISEIISKKI